MGMNDFKVGDRVIIARKTESRTGGWEYCWVSGMDRYIGKETVIVSSLGLCCGFRLEGCDTYVFPWQSLELVDELFNKIRDIKI